MGHPMQRSLTVILLLIGLHQVAAQTVSYTYLDSLSYVLYMNGEWQKLTELGKEADICSFKSNVMLQRFAFAAIKTGNYSRAGQWSECALKLSSTDNFTRDILYQSKLLAGDMRSALFLGQPLGYFSKGLHITEAGAETGLKTTNAEEPGDFRHFGGRLGLRWGNRIFIDQFFAVNRQQYFWENFIQLNYTVIPEIMLNHRFSLLAPLQYAHYSSKLEHAYTVIDSTLYSYNYRNTGKVNHKAIHVAAMLRFRQGNFDLQGGGSFFRSTTQPVYDIVWQNAGKDTIIGRVAPDSSFTQYQANGSAQWNFNLNKRSFSLGLNASLVVAEGLTAFNYRPFMTIGLTRKLAVYADYWQKGHYMVSSPFAGVLVNNVNTSTERFLVMLSYYMSSRLKLDLTWFFEKADDRLYKKQFNYNCAFVNFTFNFPS